MTDLHAKYGLTPVINLSGPLTSFGTSISSPAVCESAADSLRHHWDMDELFRCAGEVVARWSGAEAGTLTACSASGITLTVAACMTGPDLGKVARLPSTDGMKHEVVIQKGHSVNFGAPIEQMIRLAGADVVEVGTVNKTSVPELKAGLSDRTAAAMFVVSHHTAQHGYIHLEEFVQICHDAQVPVIIDAAAQDHQIERLVASGADLIVLSAQKYLAGPTGGVVCGRKDLVEAVYLQNRGIGRTMKIGKEGVFGTMVALEERMATDLADWAETQCSKADYLAGKLDGLIGVDVSLVLDQVGQPVTRVRLTVNPSAAGIDAQGLCRSLAEGSPSIKPRGHHAEEGWFFLEPNHVTTDELDYVAARIHEIVQSSRPVG
jgi:D-glucosaminate-6-phosphate ammonia-lyase